MKPISKEEKGRSVKLSLLSTVFKGFIFMYFRKFVYRIQTDNNSSPLSGDATISFLVNEEPKMIFTIMNGSKPRYVVYYLLDEDFPAKQMSLKQIIKFLRNKIVLQALNKKFKTTLD
jgi:hypothetical protein